MNDECHEVVLSKLWVPGWNGIKERPVYCERTQHLKECYEKGEPPCTCCPQCCTCG